MFKTTLRVLEQASCCHPRVHLPAAKPEPPHGISAGLQGSGSGLCSVPPGGRIRPHDREPRAFRLRAIHEPPQQGQIKPFLLLSRAPSRHPQAPSPCTMTNAGQGPRSTSRNTRWIPLEAPRLSTEHRRLRALGLPSLQKALGGPHRDLSVLGGG